LAGGITAAAATGLLARAYESAPVRNILLKLGQSKAGSRQERVLLERARGNGRIGAEARQVAELLERQYLDDQQRRGVTK
jgi:hypothetical protein